MSHMDIHRISENPGPLAKLTVIIIGLFALLMIAALSSCTKEDASVRPSADVYLLIGQSNMVRSSPAIEDMLRHSTVIKAAVGGTSVQKWQKGGPLYARAVESVGRQRVTAIMWHQGEQDAYEHTTPAEYERLLTQLFNDLRADVGNVPIVTGEVGRFLKFPSTVNDSIHTVAHALPAVSIVSSDGLFDDGDLVHFNAASQRELARRYILALR